MTIPNFDPQTNHRLANGGRLVIGSRDDLEGSLGAELEGPFGLAWCSPDGRMLVWSYRSRERAKAAGLRFQNAADVPPVMVFL